MAEGAGPAEGSGERAEELKRAANVAFQGMRLARSLERSGSSVGGAGCDGVAAALPVLPAVLMGLARFSCTACAEHRFFEAVELYDQAIELEPTNAIFWANRAFAHTKLEEYGSAIDDASRAIELNPGYIKGYYRRGTAYLAMAKLKDALKDFRQVGMAWQALGQLNQAEDLASDSLSALDSSSSFEARLHSKWMAKLVAKIAPNDPDAKRKLKDCEKAVQKLRFEEAIAIDDPDHVSVADAIEYTSIEVESSYMGARIEGTGVTIDFVKQMLEDFKNQKPLHRRYAFQILMQIRDMLRSTPTLVDVSIPDGKQFTVCGDIHGQYFDLLNIFELNGLPSEENPYLFNGDFVDRGSFSVECIFTLFALRCLYPTGLYLSRGNHESKSMNKIYGNTMAELFQEVFCALPLAHVLNGRVFVVHGGLFSTDNVKLDDIRSIDRFREPPDEGLMCELLWSDPQPGLGRSPSKRGVGVAFGRDVTRRFLLENNLELVVRSHEVKQEGYEVEHDGQLITVFSAPNYCDQMGNKGAFVKFDAPEMKPKFTQFTAVPHPNVRPMAYASNFFSMLS
eukprot:SM000126S26339  [mRNA]  locus=s126:264791:269283:- [translate_table: standard]